jgi:hypothetical protein
MNSYLRNGRNPLAVAATIFLAANLLHGADHIRQHLAGLDVAVKVGGAMLTVAAVVVFRRRHDRRAPVLAAVVGFSTAVLVAASHVAPHWSALSDSYVDDIHPDALSWTVMLFEIAAAFVLGVVGTHYLHARHGAGDGATSDLRRPLEQLASGR